MKLARKTIILKTSLLLILVLSYSYIPGSTNAFVAPTTNKVNNTLSITFNSSKIFSVAEDEIPTDMLQHVLQMPKHSKYNTFLNMEKRIHGFSGMYIDENGTLNIYTTDNSIKSISKSTLGDLVDPYYVTKGIPIKHSKHSWHKWIELESILVKLLDDKTLGITTMGIDDKNQVYDIGFEKLTNSKISVVNKFLTEHNIPQDMVFFVETGKIDLLGGGTDSSFTPGPTIRALEGGSQIGVSSNYGSCTIGFIATKPNGQAVGITAGHCVDGGRTNAANQKYTQPYSSNPSDYTSNIVGNVIASSDPATPRFSDTLLFTPSVPINLGTIYNGGPQLTIAGKDYAPIVGENVSSFGSTSGTHSDVITETGVRLADDGLGGGYVYDQVIAAFQPLGGDSGGPVWKTASDGRVLLEGTLVAQFGTYAVFSPISGIETDQGVLTVRSSPPVSLTPSNGPVGQFVHVSGSTFPPSSSVTITIGGNEFIGGTDSTGYLFTNIQIPSLSNGQYTVAVSDNYGNTGTFTFTVNQQSLYSPNTALSPNNGQVGQTIFILGSGFAVNSHVTSTFGTSTLPTFTTDSGGSLSASFSVPALSSGTYTIHSTDGSNSANSTFTITGQSICTPPSSGDWVLSSSCTLISSATAPQNVIVEPSAILTIQNGVTLTIHFGSSYLLVNPNGQVYIQPNGKLSS